MAIRIITDTASDFTVEQARELGIGLVPMTITHQGKSYRCEYDLSRSDFYKLLTETDEVPKTSQPSLDDYMTLFREAKEAGDDVLCIVISSALSGTFQSAAIAKAELEYDRIHLFDSKTGTAAQMLLTLEALRFAKEGLPVEQIIEKLQALRDRIELKAALDTLEYLYKGGRMTRAAAGAGTIMRIKPVVEVTSDGIVEVVGKSMGAKKAFDSLVSMVSAHDMDPDYVPVFIYSRDTAPCHKFMDAFHIPEADRASHMVELGATIGTHTGPGLYGIVYVRKN